MTTRELDIHGYAHNGRASEPEPRRPLVHMLIMDDGGELQSIAFHPIDAPAVAQAILAAARAAKGDRTVKITVELKGEQ